MKMFKAKKGYFIIYILISLLFPLSLWVITGSSIDNLLWLLPSLIPFALFMWIYFSTKYELINEEFHYQSAFLKGKIPVAKIKRSEEHTSELQSRPHLVCRLLLEKKKKII